MRWKEEDTCGLFLSVLKGGMQHCRSGVLPAIMAWMLFALFLLTFSVESNANQKNEQARSSHCKDSAPFFIKNRSAKAKKPYLTVDLKTNAVNGGKKTGETNQQWMWREIGDSEFGYSKNLVNVATGGCLTRKGNGALVSSE